MSGQECSLRGCERLLNDHDARGLCGLHYRRWRLFGDPSYDPRWPARRFWSKVVKTTTCWLWQGATNGVGYGQFHMMGPDGRRQRYAHRVAYEWIVGPIADGMTLDHLCRTPSCVRPDHLEQVSMATNVLRGDAPTARHARQSTCVQGHRFDRTYTDRQGYVHRKCSVCVKRHNDARSKTGLSLP